MAEKKAAPAEPKANVRALRTVHEHAQATGNSIALNPLAAEISGEDRTPLAYSDRHLRAAALHGWWFHDLHSAEPLKISESDYLAALDAADGPPNGSRACAHHAPACSPFFLEACAENARREAATRKG